MNPPPLPWAVRTAPERMILLVSAAGAVFALVLLAFSSVLPHGWLCAWREATGWPCAGCGGTRSLALLLSGRWQHAFAMNPGVVLGGAALLLLNIYAAAVLVLRLEPRRPAFPGWPWAVAAAVAANWLYLLFADGV